MQEQTGKEQQAKDPREVNPSEFMASARAYRLRHHQISFCDAVAYGDHDFEATRQVWRKARTYHMSSLGWILIVDQN